MRLDLGDMDHCFDLDRLRNWLYVIAAILVILLIVYGCSMSKTQNTQLRSFTVSQTPQDERERKFQEVIDYCTPRLQGYEDKAMRQSDKAFWMNMSGLLAGAVFAPMIIASGGTGGFALAMVAGLSGWAGATPFASDALRLSGHSGEAVAKMRNDIVVRIRDKAAIALDSTASYDEWRNAIMGIIGECTIYPMVIPSAEVTR